MKWELRKTLAQALLAWLALAWYPALAAWSLQPLNAPGTSFTQLWDINDAGQIAGNNDFGAFVYSQGRYDYLPLYQGLTATVTGISNSGTLVGILNDPNSNSGFGASFIYEGGTFAVFAPQGLTDPEIRHISSDGRYLTGVYTGGNFGLAGFVYDRASGSLTQLEAPNGAVIMQGTSVGGIAVGSLSGSRGGGLIYDTNTNTTTFVPKGNLAGQPRLRDINDTGVLTGFLSGSPYAFVGTVAGGFELLSFEGATSTTVYGLNNKGQLVGFYSSGDSLPLGFIATSVPEPATVMMMCLGLLGVFVRARSAAMPRSKPLPGPGSAPA